MNYAVSEYLAVAEAMDKRRLEIGKYSNQITPPEDDIRFRMLPISSSTRDASRVS